MLPRNASAVSIRPHGLQSNICISARLGWDPVRANCILSPPLRVLARTNEPNRAVLIEKAVNEYLNDKAGIVRLSLERLCDAIDREEAEKRPIEDWSIARDYVRSRLRRLA